MRSLPLALLAVVGLSACQGPTPEYRGTKMHSFFPFDGQRTWEFISSDIDVSYKLIGQMRTHEPEPVNGINTYFVDYSTDCQANDPDCVDGEVLRTLQWGNDAIHGAFIFSWTEGEQTTTFDPPLQITDTEMKRDDSVTTETAGFVWESTLVGFEQCPVQMNVDWADCVRMRLTVDSEAVGDGLVGDYWAIPGFNVVAIELEGETGRWQLRRHECTPDDECRRSQW